MIQVCVFCQWESGARVRHLEAEALRPRPVLYGGGALLMNLLLTKALLSRLLLQSAFDSSCVESILPLFDLGT